jgi:hypothetical protein
MAWWRDVAPVRSDRRFHFEEEPDALWRRMSDVRQYRTWWSWLREFDGVRLAEGEVWRCRVQPPAPYAVRFTVTLDEVADTEWVAATVAGDIEGSASLELLPVRRGTDVHLVSSLAPRHPALRALAVVGRPFVRMGHDWVLETGARDFDRRDGRRRSR